MFRRDAPLDALTARSAAEALGEALVGDRGDVARRLTEATHGAVEVQGLASDGAWREALDADALVFAPRSEGTAGRELALHWVGDAPPTRDGDEGSALGEGAVALEVLLGAPPEPGARAVLDALEVAFTEPYEGDRELSAALLLDGARATFACDEWRPPVLATGRGHLRWLAAAARELFPDAEVRLYAPADPLVPTTARAERKRGPVRRPGLRPSFAGPVAVMLLGFAGERLLPGQDGPLFAAFAWGFGALIVTRLSRRFVGPGTWLAALLAFAGNAALAVYLVAPALFVGEAPSEDATLQAHLLHEADLLSWAERVLYAARGAGLLWSLVYLLNRYRRL